MSQDAEYSAVPYLYKNRGAVAREGLDRSPEFTYLQLLNIQNRQEDELSSRYGTIIVNRDPAGIGANNYFFTSPPTTLSRFVNQGQSWRYAGLADGTLWRRQGDGQGEYSQIYSGLSGGLFGSIVESTFQSAQSYLFIYDGNGSIKDNGSITQLTGINPPIVPDTAIPYSPLLTMINNFASSNSYTTSGFSGWAFSTIETLTATSGQVVTDFTDFFGIQETSGGGGGGGGYSPVVDSTSGYITVSSGTNSTTSSAIFGFPSVPVLNTETVTITANVTASINSGGGTGGGSGSVAYQYSTDNGSTWTTFFTWGESVTPSHMYTLPAQNVSVLLSGILNINTLQFRLIAAATTGGFPPPAITVAGTINSVVASVTTGGTFGVSVQGIVSNLNTNTSIAIPIVSIVSTDLSAGNYQTLTVTTSTPHGLGGNHGISIYGSSNDLVDGFYTPTGATTSNTFKVPFSSPVYISASGGFVYGNAVAPASCVLVNQYASPYPSQMSAWGFYQQVPKSTSTFPIGCFSGTLVANSTGTVGVTSAFDLSISNQVTDDDLIVLTIAVANPQNVSNIRLQFDVNGSNYTSSYYYKDITPSYYQGNIANTVAAYQATQNQILADTLGLLTGAVPNSTTAQLQPGNISTGSGSWVAVYLRRGDFVPVGNAGQSGLDWSAITGWQVVVNTLTTGPTQVSLNGLYLQWGYGPSSIGGVGYDYRYTYYNSVTGTESSPSPEQYFNEQWGFLSTLSAPIFLRQAVQVVGLWSSDPQVTHIRIYRRGGTLNSNWVQIDQFPNNLAPAFLYFSYKDVVPDAAIAQAQILVLDNDPPVTSTLANPIATTLAAATINLYGSTFYQPNTLPTQVVSVADASAVFVPGQIVLVGNAYNLEEVTVVTGGTGSFTGVIQLQHNAGEQIQVNSQPRIACDLCADAYGQTWLAGDGNHPNYLYYSKKGLYENFPPQNYIQVGTPDSPIMAVINWRGTLVVGTLTTWWIIRGGGLPPQPTGSQHGIVAKGAWTEVEGAIWYLAADGLREFTGADGVYKSLPIEWVYRNQPLSLIPLADLTQQSATIMCYYNNEIYTSYISQSNNGQRFRLVFDRNYVRFRYDDVPASAMLWERDTNTFLSAKQVAAGQYAVVQDQVYTQDYDDGGWSGSTLTKTPINCTIQTPYMDLGSPHLPKQWNMLETDVNTNNGTMGTTLLFDDSSNVPSITLTNQNTGTTRQKVHYTITGQPDTGITGSGQQAYRMSILHTFSVLAAPILYQEDVYATALADFDNTFDSYWIKFGTDESKFIKQGYFDYTSANPINVNLYADGSDTAYWSFTLPAGSQRQVVRVRFGNVNPGTTAFTCRTWRIVMLQSEPQAFQMWKSPRIEWKLVGAGHAYMVKELEG